MIERKNERNKERKKKKKETMKERKNPHHEDGKTSVKKKVSLKKY